MRLRALVFGSAGQLGSELVREFTARGYAVSGYSWVEIDVLDSTKVEAAIVSAAPSVVLNATAYNMVDAAEADPELAQRVNAICIRHLAAVSRRVGSTIVHFSTDYVFDGTKGNPYCEEDLPFPLSVYGVSKLAGECYALAYNPQALVIRTSGVFGPRGRYTARGNFVELMLRLATTGEPIRVVADSIASPTYAPILAARTADLVEKGTRGLYHCGGGVSVAWFEFARSVFRIAGLNPDLLPITDSDRRTAARRPRNSALSNAKLVSLGLEEPTPLETALESYFRLRTLDLSS